MAKRSTKSVPRNHGGAKDHKLDSTLQAGDKALSTFDVWLKDAAAQEHVESEVAPMAELTAENAIAAELKYKTCENNQHLHEGEHFLFPEGAMLREEHKLEEDYEANALRSNANDEKEAKKDLLAKIAEEEKEHKQEQEEERREREEIAGGATFRPVTVSSKKRKSVAKKMASIPSAVAAVLHKMGQAIRAKFSARDKQLLQNIGGMMQAYGVEFHHDPHMQVGELVPQQTPDIHIQPQRNRQGMYESA